MLTKQLRELEMDGVIKRTVYPEVPPRVEYTITDFGKTLIPILQELCNWGSKYLGIEHHQCNIEGVINGSLSQNSGAESYAEK
jgi:DNA-binding HxlR family transcriptional regulator